MPDPVTETGNSNVPKTQAMAERLAAPFRAEDLEWRIQRSGMARGKPWAVVLTYVTNRAIQQRLDETVGIFNWRNEFLPAPDGGVMCGLSLRDEHGQWVTKWDGAENTQVEAVKGGLSGAMKRAAAQWGIGRYLYKLEATFAEIHDDRRPGAQRLVIKGSDKKTIEWSGFWSPPQLPEWATQPF